MKTCYRRLKENELSILNSKLKLNGFETFSEFICPWIKGKSLIPKIMSKLKYCKSNQR
jgi:hypothetical protein